MKTRNRRLILFFVIFGVGLITYFVLRVVFAPHVGVPQQFYEARAKSAVIAQDIVNSSNAIVADIAKVNELDRQGQYQEALAILKEVGDKNASVRTHAIDLSKELQVMTLAIPDITNDAAQQAALDSISLRLALENRLIGYTDEVGRLIIALEAHFETGRGKPSDIGILVANINAEVRAINSFNSQAGQAMDRFDGIVR